MLHRSPNTGLNGIYSERAAMTALKKRKNAAAKSFIMGKNISWDIVVIVTFGFEIEEK
jgi:hypothetical protein